MRIFFENFFSGETKMKKPYWSYHPYVPFRVRAEKQPHVLSVRPFKEGFSFEWCDTAEEADCGYTLKIRRRYSDEVIRLPMTKNPMTVTELYDFTDYEFSVVASDGRASMRRYVRTGDAIGNIVNYLHPDDNALSFSGKYLCSPSVVRMPNGAILVSHDVYESNAPQRLTEIFRSDDDGKSFRFLCDLYPSFWGKMFLCEGRLYMLSTSCEYGDLLIGSSSDGRIFGEPTVIERGCGNGKSGFHKAPVSITHANGRIWTAVEYGSWTDGGFALCILSASEKADLMKSESWTLSTPTELGDDLRRQGTAIEGCAVAGNDGQVYVIYRMAEGKALVMTPDMKNPAAPLRFHSVIDFPFAHSKFDIARADDGFYYAVGNERLPDGSAMRNILSLARSRDLFTWEKVKTVVDCSGYNKWETGFQYPSMMIEKNNIIIISRTAYNGAHSFHDSNMITFHRVEI